MTTFRIKCNECSSKRSVYTDSDAIIAYQMLHMQQELHVRRSTCMQYMHVIRCSIHVLKGVYVRVSSHTL